QEMLVWFLVTPGLLVGARLVLRSLLRALRRRGRNMRTVAVAGSTPAASDLVRVLEQSATFGVRMAGVFDDRSAERLGGVEGPLPALAGSIDELVRRARSGDIDYVFIALPMRAEARIV